MEKVSFNSNFWQRKPINEDSLHFNKLIEGKSYGGELYDYSGLNNGYRFFLSTSNGKGAVYYKESLIIDIKGNGEVFFKDHFFQVRRVGYGGNYVAEFSGELKGSDSIEVKGKSEGQVLYVFLKGRKVATMQFYGDCFLIWLFKCIKKRKYVEKDNFSGFKYNKKLIDGDLVLALFFRECIKRVGL